MKLADVLYVCNTSGPIGRRNARGLAVWRMVNRLITVVSGGFT